MSHHEGQTRASGEPYIVHPLEVAEVLPDEELHAVSAASAAAGMTAARIQARRLRPVAGLVNFIVPPQVRSGGGLG